MGQISVYFSSEEILSQFPKEELLSLIKETDFNAAEWDFTLDLYAHFNSLYEEWLVELFETDNEETFESAEDFIFAQELSKLKQEA